MNKIGFNNFRRFINFEPIDFGNVTFLVGGNNSGKSTMVKAFMLIMDYLKSGDVKKFSFGLSNIEDVNIVTYGRAKCKNAKDDYIDFFLQLEEITIELRISGPEESTTADVDLLKLSHLKSGLVFEINPTRSSVTFLKKMVEDNDFGTENADAILRLKTVIKALTSRLKRIENKLSEEYINLNAEVNNVKDKIKTLNKTIKSESNSNNVFSLTTEFIEYSFNGIIDEGCGYLSDQYTLQYNDIQKGKRPKKGFEAYRAFDESRHKIQSVLSEIYHIINFKSIVYLGATLNKQSALFAIRDKKNALSQVIHEYKQLGISSGEEAHRFVLKWMSMDEFQVGSSFEIEMHAGEAYEVMINTSGLNIPLADKGMGSIQAMLLIVRLATIIHKSKKNPIEYTVIIEEPELNLHPALQSKLALMFHQVNEEHRINFIVETHSEYLIRNTQLIVKENEYEVAPNENPITVLYFDKGIKQWNMRYRADGKFIDAFGKGFYDESAILTLDLL